LPIYEIRQLLTRLVSINTSIFRQRLGKGQKKYFFFFPQPFGPAAGYCYKHLIEKYENKYYEMGLNGNG